MDHTVASDVDDAADAILDGVSTIGSPPDITAE
jgi:hypothetical protein